jgi:hypothetical protein
MKDLIAHIAVISIARNMLAPEDLEVPGLYEVSLKDFGAGVNIADIAIESFHRAVPVGLLEDFHLFVYLPGTREQCLADGGEVDQVFGCEKISHHIPSWIDLEFEGGGQLA